MQPISQYWEAAGASGNYPGFPPPVSPVCPRPRGPIGTALAEAALPKLTKRFVDALKPVERDTLYRDTDVKGFALRAKPSGVRTWVVQYRNKAGRTRKLALGKVGVLTPDEARQRARIALGEATGGADPSAERHAQRGDITIAVLVERYLKDGPASRPDKKASSWGSDESNLRRHAIPLLGRRHLRTLTKSDGEKFQADVTAGKTKGPVTAKGAKKRGRVRVAGGPAVGARATAVFRAMLTWAVERKFLAENPFTKIKLNKPNSRERYLSDAELGRVGEVMATMESEGFNPASLTIARLLLLTGARRNEIACLRWGYIDAQRGALLLPDSKTGQKTVPLGGPALLALADWRERAARTPAKGFVFPGARGTGHHVGFAKVWREVRKRAALEGVRLHDLRHTHASVGVALNQSLLIVGKILGHRKAETTERYSHLQLDPVLAAADQTARRVSDAMSGGRADSSNVLQLKGSKAG